MEFTHNASEYLISLLKSALDGTTAPAAPEGLSLSELYKLAKYHSVANVAYYALERNGTELTTELKKQWSALRDKAIVADITLQADYEELCGAFAQQGIRLLPLKGILMKSLYPQSDYRTMSDIDILIDAENAERVRAVMEGLGYETADFGHDVHDVYHKPPLTSIEVHRELFGAEGREFSAIFADPWAVCHTMDGVWRFTAEYFLAFLLAHGMKHYEQGGTGIRTFMDIHVYRKHCGATLDLGRIYGMFESVGQRKLCEDFVALSEMWFEDREPTEALSEMERYILSGGTYGTFSNQVENAIKAKGRASYVWSKLFPDLKTMRQRYSVLNKAPVLLPVFWVVRIVTKPFANRRQNMKVEVQLRTIAMDFWASLEHKMKYKKDIDGSDEIVAELKRCADSIAELDKRMQDINEGIENLQK